MFHSVVGRSPHYQEFKKIIGDVKTPEDVKHSGSDHPQGVSAPSFHTAPL